MRMSLSLSPRDFRCAAHYAGSMVQFHLHNGYRDQVAVKQNLVEKGEARNRLRYCGNDIP